MSRYASRKFIAALLGLASVHWALIERLIDASTYKAVLLGTLGVYIAGNVVQRVMAGAATPASTASTQGAP